MSVSHGAAHDTAKDVSAALVGRHDSVGDQERGRSQVVRDDAMVRPAGAVGLRACHAGGGFDEAPHQVGVVVVVLSLKDRADALQSHSGVDGRAGQRVAGLVRVLLVLHEDEVPDLDEPVSVLVRAAGRSAGDVRAVIVEDLGARPAGAGRAHHPEIVGGGDADDALFRQPGDLLPEVRRGVVVVIDGDEEPVLRQAEVAGEKVPGQRDRLLLEVVAEGEVAEHLEKGVMAGRVADVVEIVVLAAGADAFLAGGGTGVGAALDAGEEVLELDHA